MTDTLDPPIGIATDALRAALADAERQAVAENGAPGETGSEGVETPSGKPKKRKKAAENGGETRKPSAWGFDLDEMNREFAFVLMGSKPVVMREQPGAPVEDRVRVLGLEAFRAYFHNRRTEVMASDGKIKVVSWAERWLSNTKRRTYDGIEFVPGAQEGDGRAGYLNLWRGFSVEPDAAAGSYSIFRDHLLTNVCRGDQSLFDWIFAWFAHLVQRPRERIGTSLVFRGKMGTGKTKIGEVIGSLIEDHFFLVDEPRYITGQFNAHMASCLLLQAEEAVWAGDKAAEGRLKSLITSKIQMIEAKGIDPIRIANYVRLIMTSNEGWVVPAGMDERRFAVFDVGDGVKGNFAYFREMDEQLAAGGRAALLADLLAFDLSTVELRDIPKTEALLEQKIRSLDSVEAWWFERLRDGAPTVKHRVWETEVQKDDFLGDYFTDSEAIGVKRRSRATEMGMALRRVCPGIREARKMFDHGPGDVVRKRCYILPSLADCRAAFEATVQQPIAWPDSENLPVRESDIPPEFA